jgi:hypothetical protein
MSFNQGHLNSSINPWAKQCTWAFTYTTIHRNKIGNVDKIKINIFIVLLFPTKSMLKH